MKKIKFSLSLTTVFNFLILFSCLYCSKVAYATTFSHTYDKTRPAGTEVPSILDDMDRLMKLAIQERENVDHYWPYANAADVAGGNEVASSFTGEHRKITFYGPISTPTNVTNKMFVYGKDVGGKIELHVEDEDGNEIQFSSAGAFNVALLTSKTITTPILTSPILNTGVSGTAVLDEDNMASDSDTQLATQQSIKAYVDTKEDALVTQATASIFGAWTNQDSDSNTLLKDAVYKATSDGFLSFYTTSLNGLLKGYTDGSNPPTTQRTYDASYSAIAGANSMMPVRKDDYWKVTDSVGTPTIYWHPIGTGECQKQ